MKTNRPDHWPSAKSRAASPLCRPGDESSITSRAGKRVGEVDRSKSRYLHPSQRAGVKRQGVAPARLINWEAVWSSLS